MGAPDQTANPLPALLSDQHEDLTALTAAMEQLAAADEEIPVDRADRLLQERFALESALRDREDEIFQQLDRAAETGAGNDPRHLRSARSLVLARGLARGANLDPSDVVMEIVDELRGVMLDNREDWSPPPGLQD